MKKGIVATSAFRLICLFLLCPIAILGCDASLTVANRTIGVSSGNFIYTDGSLTTNYNYPFDYVWKACEETLKEMKATSVVKNLKIAKGTIDGVAQEEKIHVVVEYLSKDQTSVSVRVGMSGNNLASQLIHEKIANYLSKVNRPEEP